MTLRFLASELTKKQGNKLMELIPEDLIIHKPDKFLKQKMDSFEIKEKVLFQKEGDFFDISVVQSPLGKFLKFQDTYQAGFINTKTYKGNLPYINYFLIPYLMNKNIQSILLIGFGSGIIVNQFEKIFKKLKRIDIVDIEDTLFPLAEKYFNFKTSEKQNFYLQDALVYLKTAKKKYDLIIVDVAGNFGIDERFLTSDYLNLVKNKLKKGGIFVSNLPSSCDIFNKKNKIILDLFEKYKAAFKNIDIYNGETSNKIYYKTFFDIDEIVLDITNLILISSDTRYDFKIDDTILDVLGVDIEKFFADLVHHF